MTNGKRSAALVGATLGVLSVLATDWKGGSGYVTDPTHWNGAMPAAGGNATFAHPALTDRRSTGIGL